MTAALDDDDPFGLIDDPIVWAPPRPPDVDRKVFWQGRDGAHPSCARMRAWTTGHRHMPIVVVTELAENESLSITNGAEGLHARVRQVLDVHTVEVYEHYEATSVRTDRFAQVWLGPTNAWPVEWRYISVEDLAARIG